MQERPQSRLKDRARARPVRKARCRILARLGQHERAEQQIPRRVDSGKVLIDVVGLQRVMDTMVLRRGAQPPQSAQAELDIRVLEMGEEHSDQQANVSLTQFRGHLPRGGYDVQNGIKQWRPSATTAVL